MDWSIALSRIFVSLSLLPLLLVISTMGVGWWIGDYNGTYSRVVAEAKANPGGMNAERAKRDREVLAEPQRRFKIHFQLGLATSLAVVLINSLSVTYLIGTSRWVKEVCEAYGLDAKYIDESTKIKRATFPWSVSGVFAIIVVIALGAASDPGTLRDTTGNWVLPHLIGALTGTCIIVTAIFLQAIHLHRNSQIIEEVVAEVQREREARGLPVEPS